ncbi:AMP-binding protein [Aequorivita viscosa]|nr:AMP-binding protein [Aequorivita viscosa]
MLHPKFKFNGEAFSSAEALAKRAKRLFEAGKNDESAIGKFILEWLDEHDFIIVKTSGSTGVPKEIKLQKKHVFNSAEATVNYFDIKEETKALLCLPAEYIAGKMMLVRAMIAGWNLHTATPGRNPLENQNGDFDFTAMVPYQVFHSLADLHKVKKLIIGGGAVPWKLEEQLQALPTKIFATYGMTETISHIAARPINGTEKSTLFTALPKVDFSQNENGCLQINASEISEELVVTNDVVELISSTSFKFLGRIDNVINTGGVKVHPEMIEEKLSLHINTPFFIASETDEALGERVILVVEGNNTSKPEDYLDVFGKLSAYEKPKKIYNTPQFIYTETGKIKRAEVLKML